MVRESMLREKPPRMGLRAGLELASSSVAEMDVGTGEDIVSSADVAAGTDEAAEEGRARFVFRHEADVHLAVHDPPVAHSNVH